MSETSDFFLDIVRSMPLNSKWIAQVPHREFLDSIRPIPYVLSDNVFVQFVLKEEYREILASIPKNDLHELVSNLEVWDDNKKIFEAFDGFEIGTISKEFEINGTPLEHHLNQDILYISRKW